LKFISLKFVQLKATSLQKHHESRDPDSESTYGYQVTKYYITIL